MPNKGLLIVLSGPSGSGKDTILKELIKRYPNMKISISATTRPPRKNEVNGKDYYFISKTEFIQLLSKNQMLEHAEYCDNYYGTPQYQVDDWLQKGSDVLLEIEVQGGSQIKKKCPDAVSIFILPPSIDELRRRLISRATDPMEIIEKRMSAAEGEVRSAFDYDYIVVNDSVGGCVERIYNIIQSEKMRSFRSNNLIEEVLENV